MQELVARTPGLDQTFHRIDVNRFTAAIYQNGQKILQRLRFDWGRTHGQG